MKKHKNLKYEEGMFGSYTRHSDIIFDLLHLEDQLSDTLGNTMTGPIVEQTWDKIQDDTEIKVMLCLQRYHYEDIS